MKATVSQLSNYKTFRYIVTSILLFVSYLGYSQQVTEEDFKVALSYKLLNNIEWQEGIPGKKFMFAVLSEDTKIQSKFNSLQKLKVKGKGVVVESYTSLSAINKHFDAIFVDYTYSTSIHKILQHFEGKSTLLISDQAEDQRNVMINLLKVNNKLTFEVNKSNILIEKMAASSEILLLGGKAIDVAKLYKEAKRELEQKIAQLQAQSKQLQDKQQQITVHKSELSRQREELQSQKDELQTQQLKIVDQNKAIEQSNLELEAQKANLDKLLGDIDKQNENLAEKVALINKQEKDMLIQKKELAEGAEKLKAQKDEIEKQEAVLLKQNLTITTQENMIYVAGGFVVLLVFLAFFIYRSMQVQKRAKVEVQAKKDELESMNVELKTSREEVMTQNEELFQQQEEILAINETLAFQKEELTLTNHEITTSINYAKTIQEAVLPTEETIQRLFPKHFVYYEPKDIVSGDFYFVTKRDNKRIVAVVDCTGHGVPGAFMSLMGLNIFDEVINKNKETSPAKILEYLNHEIKDRLKQEESNNDDGMDLGICAFEEAVDGKTIVTFSGAKNNLYLVRKSGDLEIIKGDRASIGGLFNIRKNHTFTNQEFTVEEGDMMYMTTDGFQDQCDIERRKIATKGLKKLLMKFNAEKMNVQAAKFEAALKEHQGKAAQRDDITLFGIRV